MSPNVYKHIHLTGTSGTSIEDAVNTAIAKASRTVHNMRWFEIIETRGAIGDGAVTEWQATIRVGFTLDD